MSFQQRRKKDPLKLEGDLFAAIATMDQLSKYFDRGIVEETLYRRQLKSCISDVFKTRMQLDETGFNIQDFISRQNLNEKYPEGLRRLELAEGLEDESSIEYTNMKQLPEKTADFVANTIELIDLLKLRSVARVEYIVPLLDDMISIVGKFPNMGSSHWSSVEMDGWRSSLVGERPSMVLNEEQCEKLEFDASRWLSDFRKQIKEL
ncbi:MAG: hypothetical protein OEZ01_14435 [Candidatus Heimdallarchaeota archaeon]|nr:hypothetical protein [Candidatus Heimdallarchaeota archaeon]MDH5647206.1 hypothetical protein [Candidatus Heimdallarchaeota archaeon]